MLKKLLIVPALGLGVLILLLMMRGQGGSEAGAGEELTPTVRVLEVPRTPVVPRAVGYGEVRARRVWQAVPQVGGRIIELSPKIKEGTFVSEGEVLVRIDRADYDLEVKVAQARLTAYRAQLSETRTREETTRSSLEIEKRSLALAEAELKRLRQLGSSRTVSEAEVDREERSVLAQRLRVQEIENGLTLLGPQREVLEAQIEQETLHLERANLAVERTVIRAPYALRIGPVSVEQDQVVQVGQTLFRADGTDASEVTAWLPLRGIRQVLAPGTAQVEVLTDPEELMAQVNLESTIRIAAGAMSVSWEGKVVRIRGIDSQTRSLGIDVAVEDPYEGFVPGSRPPLVPGLYVEVEIRAPARPNQVVVPRSALHADTVYLVDSDERLEIRRVEVGFAQSEFAVVSKGLAGGETLVLSDLVPAIQRMRLDPVADAEALEALLEDASGEGEAR